jgi:hypothetical protein
MMAQENESALRGRSTREVFEDHLRLARQQGLEEDIRRNIAPDCVFLTDRGVYRGHDGARYLAHLLARELGPATFEYYIDEVVGSMAFLVWSATGSRGHVVQGADSFLISDGRIVVQTIAYRVVPNDQGSDNG